ncbi:LysR family transcriptional regulator [Oceanibaculum indicum]|uniref:DNA-binding transcriptional LysR family regulator n=1 Tax=Oceanibaculum indicum TaxID=526216 RepID=A0A420WA68_9PROT|nr:LysR family transcriptional regulator [Oceanibaculum indicum]RKQ67873.1 DNA-binding transcriptional LysR family regulator [Oceanibaculum indicum]
MMNASMLEPELLRAFVAVAEQQSFTRAAVQLNRTQSAVSMQIRRLEERLGVELFERASSGVRLSRAGEGLIGYARRILLLGEEAVGRLRTDAVRGAVRIGVMEDYGTCLLPPVLAGFAAAHPAIDIEMQTGLTGSMIERLGEAYDLVIAMHPEGTGGGQLLRRERPVWAAGIGRAVETIDPLPLALYPQGCLFRRWVLEALDAARRPWRLAFVSHSLGAVAAVAAQGLAVTVVKAATFPPGLRALSPSDGVPSLPVAEIRLHRAATLTPAAALLADHLAAALSA